MTTGKTETELLDLIRRDLAAAGPKYAVTKAKSIYRTGGAPPYNWGAEPGTLSGRVVSADEKRKLIEIQIRLRREYHLMTVID